MAGEDGKFNYKMLDLSCETQQFYYSNLFGTKIGLCYLINQFQIS